MWIVILWTYVNIHELGHAIILLLFGRFDSFIITETYNLAVVGYSGGGWRGILVSIAGWLFSIACAYLAIFVSYEKKNKTGYTSAMAWIASERFYWGWGLIVNQGDAHNFLLWTGLQGGAIFGIITLIFMMIETFILFKYFTFMLEKEPIEVEEEVEVDFFGSDLNG